MKTLKKSDKFFYAMFVAIYFFVNCFSVYAYPTDCDGNSVVSKDELPSYDALYKFYCIDAKQRSIEDRRGKCIESDSSGSFTVSELPDRHNNLITKMFTDGSKSTFTAPGNAVGLSDLSLNLPGIAAQKDWYQFDSKSDVHVQNSNYGINISYGDDNGISAMLNMPQLVVENPQPIKPVVGQPTGVQASWKYGAGFGSNANIGPTDLRYGVDGDDMGGGAGSTVIKNFSSSIVITPSKIGKQYSESQALSQNPSGWENQNNISYVMTNFLPDSNPNRFYIGDDLNHVLMGQRKEIDTVLGNYEKNATTHVSSMYGSHDVISKEILVNDICAATQATNKGYDYSYDTAGAIYSTCDLIFSSVLSEDACAGANGSEAPSTYKASKTQNLVDSCLSYAGYNGDKAGFSSNVIDSNKLANYIDLDGVPTSVDELASYYSKGSNCANRITANTFVDPMGGINADTFGARPAIGTFVSDAAGVLTIQIDSDWYVYNPMQWSGIYQWGPWVGSRKSAIPICKTLSTENTPCQCSSSCEEDDTDCNECTGTQPKCDFEYTLSYIPVFWKRASGAGSAPVDYVGQIHNLGASGGTPISNSTGMSTGEYKIEFLDAESVAKNPGGYYTNAQLQHGFETAVLLDDYNILNNNEQYTYSTKLALQESLLSIAKQCDSKENYDDMLKYFQEMMLEDNYYISGVTIDDAFSKSELWHTFVASTKMAGVVIGFATGADLLLGAFDVYNAVGLGAATFQGLKGLTKVVFTTSKGIVTTINLINNPDGNKFNLTDLALWVGIPGNLIGTEQIGEWQKVVDLVGNADTWNDRKGAALYLIGFKTGDSELDFSSPDAAVRSMLDLSFAGLVTLGGVGEAFPSLNPQ